ncbi:MAG: hypothetical protein R2716_06360 [Microthrixaceae bacterium]
MKAALPGLEAGGRAGAKGFADGCRSLCARGGGLGTAIRAYGRPGRAGGGRGRAPQASWRRLAHLDQRLSELEAEASEAAGEVLLLEARAKPSRGWRVSWSKAHGDDRAAPGGERDEAQTPVRVRPPSGGPPRGLRTERAGKEEQLEELRARPELRRGGGRGDTRTMLDAAMATVRTELDVERRRWPRPQTVRCCARGSAPPPVPGSCSGAEKAMGPISPLALQGTRSSANATTSSRANCTACARAGVS